MVYAEGGLGRDANALIRYFRASDKNIETFVT